MPRLLLFIWLFSISLAQGQSLLGKYYDHSLPMGFTDIMPLGDGSFLATLVLQPPSFDSTLAAVVKLDSNLNIKWSHRYRGLARDDFASLTALADGHVLVGGTMRQNFINQSGASVFKLDTAGNIIWQKVYSSTFDDRILRMFERPDSSLMIFVRHGVSNQPTKILHADAQGNLLSKRRFFNGNRGIFAEAVTVDTAHNYYMSGAWFNTNTGRTETFVLALNASTVLWYRHFDFGRSTNSYSIHLSPDGQLLLGGTIEDSMVSNSFNVYLLKLDLQGSVNWAREYGSANGASEFLSGFRFNKQGEIMAYGRAQGNFATEAMLFKLSGTGNLLWSRSYLPETIQTLARLLPITADRWLLQMAASSSNGDYLFTVDNSGTAPCSNDSLSMWSGSLNPAVSTQNHGVSTPNSTANVLNVTVTSLAVEDSLLCSAQIGTEEAPAMPQWSIYPNPAYEVLYLEYDGTQLEQVKITLIAPDGQYLPVRMSWEQSRLSIALTDLARGLYLLHIESQGSVYQHRFLKL